MEAETAIQCNIMQYAIILFYDSTYIYEPPTTLHFLKGLFLFYHIFLKLKRYKVDWVNQDCNAAVPCSIVTSL
jgi:hypothetical protein